MMNFNDLVVGTFNFGSGWLKQQEPFATPETYAAAVENWRQLQGNKWFSNDDYVDWDFRGDKMKDKKKELSETLKKMADYAIDRLSMEELEILHGQAVETRRNQLQVVYGSVAPRPN